MQRHVVSIVTDTNGDFTGYTDVANGLVHAVRFVDTDLDNGGDITITGAASGIAILTLTDQASTATFMPRGATHDTSGTASLYAGSGEPVEAPIPVANEAIKVVVAQGGNTTSATLHIYVG